MTSAEKIVHIEEEDLVKSANGAYFLTDLGHRWQGLSLLEQIIANHENSETSFSTNPEYMEDVQRKREELLAGLPGGNDPESREKAFSILEEHNFFPWQINHLPPAGVIFPPTNR